MSKKERCPKCKRMLRCKHFRKNEVTGELMCKRCSDKIGSNKFYAPKQLKYQKKEVITKFSMTKQERDLIAKKKGYKRLNENLKILSSMKNKHKKSKCEEEVKKQQEEEQKKKKKEEFVKGLK